MSDRHRNHPGSPVDRPAEVPSPAAGRGSGEAGRSVAVVVPSFNHGRFLASALDSVLAQSAPVTQLIVVDDGSTDDTRRVLEAYPEVEAVHQANRGRPAARNRGLQLVRCDYVGFLDADDELEPAFVERCRSALEARPEAGFAYTFVQRFGDDDEVITPPPYDFELLKRGNYISVCSLFRSAALQAYRFDESLSWGWEDWDLFIGLGERGIEGVLVPEPLFRYRAHPGQLSVWLDASPCRWRRLRVAIVRRHLRAFGLAEYLHSMLRMFYRCSQELLNRREGSAPAPHSAGGARADRPDRDSG